MSLINQMLQELDARGAPAALGGGTQGHVRAVPQRRGVHPAWWLALTLACALLGGGLWVLLGQAKPTTPASAPLAKTFPLKIETELSRPSSLPREVTSASPIEQIAMPVPVVSEPVKSEPRPVPVATPVLPAPVAASPKVAAVPAVPEHNVPLVGAAASPAVSVSVPPVPQTMQPVPASVPAVLPSAGADRVITKQVRELTPQQLAENEYRKASILIQQGRTSDALTTLEQALRLDARHAGARQTMVALLIESQRQEEALRILREGLQLDPGQTGLAMILARMQLERGELKPAVSTLQRSLPHAAERADYQAFLAALLQRDGRHREAIEHYASALRKSPDNGLWWMGQAISLQAESRNPEAIAAYNRAKAGNGLSAELKVFVEEKLNSL